MKTVWLTITLQSDATFGRGDGVAGLINADVQHDENGLPYMGGKTVKGLLGATCSDILFALNESNSLEEWETAAQRLFGGSGSRQEDSGILHVGDAKFPDDLRVAIADEIQQNAITREEVLDSLTGLRRQTAMSAETGAPRLNSLRTIRTILRETVFTAQLDFMSPPQDNDLPLLAACAKGLKRAGSNRNRGLGRIVVELYETNPATIDSKLTTNSCFEKFQTAITSQEVAQ